MPVAGVAEGECGVAFCFLVDCFAGGAEVGGEVLGFGDGAVGDERDAETAGGLFLVGAVVFFEAVEAGEGEEDGGCGRFLGGEAEDAFG